MANTNQSVRKCILTVDICCNGCKKKASNKLKSISGVSEVEYNSEKGLMTVTGDVEPMALVRKLTKHGKKTELVSVKYELDDDDDDDDDPNSDEDDTSSNNSSTPDPKTLDLERVVQEKMMKQKTGPLKKPSLLGCFSSKSKVAQPLPRQHEKWHIPSKFGNRPPGFGFPFANATTSQRCPPHPHPHPYPYPHPMMPCQQVMQQHPQVPITGPAMPCNGGMFQPARPPTQNMSKGGTKGQY